MGAWYAATSPSYRATLLLLTAAIVAGSGQAAAPVRLLHNLPGQAQVYLAAGDCAAWRIEDWQEGDLHATATLDEGSRCLQQTLRRVTFRHLAACCGASAWRHRRYAS
jgi:hypothetical protein